MSYFDETKTCENFAQEKFESLERKFFVELDVI